MSQPLHARLTDKGTIRFKLPRKGARWQGPVKDIGAAVDKALKEGCEPPFAIHYVTKER